MNRKKINDYINSYQTESEFGFNPKEHQEVIKYFGGFDVMNEDKYYSALRGITCMMNERKETILYPCDIIHAVYCGLENRDLSISEWD